VGILLGFSVVEPKDFQDLQTHVQTLVNGYDVYLPQLSGFDLSRVEVEWTRLRSSIPEIWKFNNDGREFQVGEAMKARGLNAEFPVVLIPGIISTVRQRCTIYQQTSQPVCMSSGLRILVNGPRVSPLLPRETMGRLQYVIPGNLQQRKMDICHDAGPRYWAGSP